MQVAHYSPWEKYDFVGTPVMDGLAIYYAPANSDAGKNCCLCTDETWESRGCGTLNTYNTFLGTSG